MSADLSVRTLDLRLLGGFRASRGTADLALPTRKACGLLAYLAMPAGHPRSREELTALLWGERPEAQARTSFRQALATVRRTAVPGGEPVIVVDHDAVLLNPGAVSVDVARFERFVGMGTPGALAEAADLYRGDFLGTLIVDEPGFDGWRTTQRERLHELALEALGRLLAVQIKNNQEGHAIQTALRLLELEPLQEAVHRTLMRLYVAQGRRAAALRQYRLCVEALRRDVGSQPEPETQALHRRIVGHQPLGVEGVSAHGHETARGAALGGKRSPLVGRHDEVTQLGAALERAWSEGGRAADGGRRRSAIRPARPCRGRRRSSGGNVGDSTRVHGGDAGA